MGKQECCVFLPSLKIKVNRQRNYYSFQLVLGCHTLLSSRMESPFLKRHQYQVKTNSKASTSREEGRSSSMLIYMAASRLNQQIMLFLLLLRRRRQSATRRKKRFWIRDIFKERKTQEDFHNVVKVVKELRLTDREFYFRCVSNLLD